MYNILDHEKKVVAKLLIQDIKNHPERWVWRNPDSRTAITHTRYGITLWIADFAAYIYEPGEIKFGWVDWWRLRSAFRHWRDTRGSELINTHQAKICTAVQQRYLSDPVDKQLLDEKHFVKRVGG